MCIQYCNTNNSINCQHKTYECRIIVLIRNNYNYVRLRHLKHAGYVSSIAARLACQKTQRMVTKVGVVWREENWVWSGM